MMLPLVGVPEAIATEFGQYRPIFCRRAGFEHVQRYVMGLLLSENKTLQGIHAQIVSVTKVIDRRGMHAAVVEAGWDSEGLMPLHRAVVAGEHRGQGREVISQDWTLVHHDRGANLFGVKRGYDYVEHCMSQFQTVITATIANQQWIDGLEVVVQRPNFSEAEREYLKMSAKTEYETLEEVRARMVELLHYHKNRLEYRKRTEIALEIVREIEVEGQFPNTDHAFDNGLLTREFTELIEVSGKHCVSEIECS